MPQHRVVFLFDVDNTLLDNDRVTRDLRNYLEREVGPGRSAMSISSKGIMRSIQRCWPSIRQRT
jgi:hypothetical protein